MKIITMPDTEIIDNKYHIYQDKTNNKVICTTFYKGKTIRATAQCNPEDTFNFEIGKKLAYLRCKQKFLKKKAERAADAYAKAWVAAENANDKLQRTIDFVDDVTHELTEIKRTLSDLEADLEN